MRVLVTGVTGFVGGHLAALCSREGAEVIGIGRREGGRVPHGRYLPADLADPRATRAAVAAAAPERVFHLAANASVAASWRAPGATLHNNLHATLNLLEALRAEAPDARVLVAGSGEVYGPVAADRLPVGEGEPLAPHNPYAVSKAAVELLSGFYAAAHRLAVVRTRAFNHAGPGQSDSYVVSAFARQVAEGEIAERGDTLAIATGNLGSRRDFTDVRDVVRAYWLALEHAEPGVFNVCSGHATAAADILAGLARHSRLQVEGHPDPDRIRRHEVMEIRGSHTRLTDATGWQPEIPLERTLADTLEWWRERLAAEARG